MRLLIDTHILLWWLADDDRLPAGPREAVNTAEEVRLHFNPTRGSDAPVAAERMRQLLGQTAGASAA